MRRAEVESFITFEAAHRLYNVNTYTKECRLNLHGHSYEVKCSVTREDINNAGMVVDFKLLKEVLREKIEEPFDHSCILNVADPLAIPISENCEKVHIVDQNPTAEWMADTFFDTIEKALRERDPELIVTSVSVRETEKNLATVRRVD